MIVLISTSFPFNPFWLNALFQSIILGWGAFFYLFACSLLDEKFKFKPLYLLFFLPIPIAYFLILNDVTISYAQNKTLGYILSLLTVKQIITIIYVFTIVFFNVTTLIKYYQTLKRQSQNDSSTKVNNPVWLRISIWGFIIACAIVQLSKFFELNYHIDGFDWRIIGMVTFLFYFCILFYVSISSGIFTEKVVRIEKYKNTRLTEIEANRILSHLDRLIFDELIFANQDLKLMDLAQRLNTNEKTLSFIINKYKKQNYSDFINSFRIEYAKKLLSDPTLSEKTILWVLFESGFNSKSTFNTLFKKVEGITPAQYRKEFSSELCF
jgi:AraC-like DNA-binding protein